MWDLIERMASDRLWIYTALVGSLFGLAFSTYIKGTRIGLWAYAGKHRGILFLQFFYAAAGIVGMLRWF